MLYKFSIESKFLILGNKFMHESFTISIYISNSWNEFKYDLVLRFSDFESLVLS